MAILAALVPASAPIGSASITLTAVGEGFLADDVIVFNGGDEETAFVSDTQLTTGVKPYMSTVPGAYPVLVRSSGGDSAPLDFTLTPAENTGSTVLLQRLIHADAGDVPEILRQAPSESVAVIRREWQAYMQPEAVEKRDHFVSTRDAIIAEMARREIPYA